MLKKSMNKNVEQVCVEEGIEEGRYVKLSRAKERLEILRAYWIEKQKVFSKVLRSKSDIMRRVDR